MTDTDDSANPLIFGMLNGNEVVTFRSSDGQYRFYTLPSEHESASRQNNINWAREQAHNALKAAKWRS